MATVSARFMVVISAGVMVVKVACKVRAMVRIGVRSKPTNRALRRLTLGLIYGHSRVSLRSQDRGRAQ